MEGYREREIGEQASMEPSSDNELSEPLLLSKSSSMQIVSRELEDTLNNTELSYFQRVRTGTWLELKTLFHLAAPAVVVYLLNNVISMSTQIYCGHLGNLELAASSLGNTGIQVFAYGLMVQLINFLILPMFFYRILCYVI